MLTIHDVLETNQMIQKHILDVRTITMGISLLDCCSSDGRTLCKNIYDKVTRYGEHLVQTGDYYRLVNPFENNNHVLWQFVSKDKKETVVCGVRLHSEANPHIYLLYPQGLDADMKYEDVVTGKVYTGAALMKAGLPLPLTTGDYQPIKFTFRSVEK